MIFILMMVVQFHLYLSSMTAMSHFGFIYFICYWLPLPFCKQNIRFDSIHLGFNYKLQASSVFKDRGLFPWHDELPNSGHTKLNQGRARKVWPYFSRDEENHSKPAQNQTRAKLRWFSPIFREMKRANPKCPKLNQGGTKMILPYFLRNEKNRSKPLGLHMIQISVSPSFR